MRLKNWAAAAVAAIVMSGCMEAETVVTVKRDGSGTIEQTILMNKDMLSMVEGMANMSSEQGGGSVTGKVSSPLSPEQLKAAAPKLGPGVEYVSCDNIERGTLKGVKALYKFADVTRLTVNQAPDVADEMSQQPSAAPGDNGSVSFAFAGGKEATLTITQPQPDYEAKEPAQDPVVEPQEQGEKLAMLKQMYGEMKMALRIRVDGEIKKTNAAHVDSPAGRKDTVTLFEMDFSKLLETPQGINKLILMGSTQDMNNTKKILKDLPGIKIETAPKIEITF